MLNYSIEQINYQIDTLPSYSLAEQYWARWYIMIGNPTLATGLLAFIMHEVVYFGRFLPWYIISKIPYFQKYKLQQAKVPTDAEQWGCARDVLWLHFTIELPLIMSFHPIGEFIGLKTWQIPFPNWKTIVGQVIFCFVLEDFWHYGSHRVMHWGPLYRSVHKLHHKYSAPFGLAAEYAHPVEIIVLGLGTICGPFVYLLIKGDFHLITVYIWIILRLFQVIDAHSGYDFPWSLHNILPFWGGADFHDFHHLAFNGNYSSSFRIWDVIFGTDQLYRKFKNQKDAGKQD